MIEIRLMGEADLDQVEQIERETFSLPWSREGFAVSLASKDTIYVTACEQEKVIGYCGLLQSFDEADITNVAVAKDYRNSGIGRNMLEKLVLLGMERGITRFSLEVRCSNQSAIHLYEKLGFVSAGVRKKFYEKPREDAFIMWKEQ